MIKAIIFDMDGLMIDSERVTFECYQERLKDMNLTMDEEFYKTLLGKPIKGIYQRFMMFMEMIFLFKTWFKMYIN